jgi:hypothetical protein
MSEFIREWPSSGSSIADHARHMQKGMEAYNKHLLLPEDKRFDIAYGALTQGKKGVFAEGLTRSGKSQFGEDVIGAENTVNIKKQDTVAILEGYESPTNPGMFIKGKMKIKDPQNIVWNFDEISHMRSSGDLHDWWTGSEKIMPDGTKVDLENMVTYASANFADGIRSFDIDSAMRSRLGLYILSGDVGMEVAKLINRRAENQTPLGEEFKGGLIPEAKTRKAIREYMQQQAPASDEAIDFATEVINLLNNSRLVNPNDVDLSNTDAVKGWIHAARARRLVGLRKDKEGIPVIEGVITRQELIFTAPIALGSLATLSYVVAGELKEKMGYEDERNLSDIERAVFTNRAIAAIAKFQLMRAEGDLSLSRDEAIAEHLKGYSYANLPESAPEDIDQVLIEKLLRKQEVQDEPVEPQKRKSIRQRIGDVISN